MAPRAPTVGVAVPGGFPSPDTLCDALADAVADAGGEPVLLPPAPSMPAPGVALAREWAADATEAAGAGLDALLLADERPEVLFGTLLAAGRLDLPVVCAPPPDTPLAAAVTALGLTPLSGEPAAAAVAVGAEGGPTASALLKNFPLANALRAGIAAGGGPEMLVHLSAVAREAGVAGFSRMVRVLVPETPAAGPSWTRENGVPALLASLGESLHDIPTVAGELKEHLPPDPPPPPEDHRLRFVRARASGAEAVCLVPDGAPDPAGECRVYGSEQEAAQAVGTGVVPDGALLVVAGCGPRGGGLMRLETLGEALRETGLRAPVVTDGLPPADPPGSSWVTLFTPEAATGGVIGRLADGDFLRLDLEGGRVRTGIRAGELEDREPLEVARPTGAGYAARYARSALPALEGAGFA